MGGPPFEYKSRLNKRYGRRTSSDGTTKKKTPLRLNQYAGSLGATPPRRTKFVIFSSSPPRNLFAQRPPAVTLWLSVPKHRGPLGHLKTGNVPVESRY